MDTANIPFRQSAGTKKEGKSGARAQGVSSSSVVMTMVSGLSSEGAALLA